ncbi:hypothetical protein ACFL6X_09620 [Candidatus Latescibacterota bacterium]
MSTTQDDKQGWRSVAGAVAGLMGVACLGWAAAGMLGLLDGERQPAPPLQAERAPAPTHEEQPAVEMAEAVPVLPPAAPLVERASHYPLEVGRYWVYRYEDPHSGDTAEVERAIVRHEKRDRHDLYFYDDGVVVYYEGGRIFELGADGGVNVIPLDPESGPEPYVYRSQGMQIAKRIGAQDTVLVAGDRRYEGCMEVITEFRALDGDRRHPISYSSFYARGVGLVGRERWPRDSNRGLSVVLGDHGTKQL